MRLEAGPGPHLAAMIYKFKSPASGDVIMLAPQGDQMLRLLGREPAAQGIIEVAAIPAAIQALQSAIDGADTAGAAKPADDGAESSATEGQAQAVGLRARLWPMIELLRRSHEEGAAVVWGV